MFTMLGAIVWAAGTTAVTVSGAAVAGVALAGLGGAIAFSFTERPKNNRVQNK